MNTHLIEQAAASVAARPRLLPLTCAIQHYAWGGYHFIPALLGRENRERQPCAELWIGAHPVAPATATIDGIEAPLDQLLAQVPQLTLPYLLKILDVRAILSIQAHPNRSQAEVGFERETAAGIPLSAPQRTYKDANHKPEACVALSEFWMLHGFKAPEAIADTLDAVPELRSLAPRFREDLAAATADATARRALVRSLYESVMTRPQAELDRALAPLVGRLVPLHDDGTLTKDTPDFWAARAAAQFPLPAGHLDRGIVSVYLLNLVRLLPGQGAYLPAGALHAYLEGVAVEIMASSDNVLRGGLTPKHVDVAELLKILTFDAGRPVILDPEAISPAERVYRTPAREFELSRVDLSARQPYRRTVEDGADVLVVLEGEVRILGAGEAVTLQRGGTVLAPRGISYELRAPRSATLYKASVPRSL
ncbi:MAG: mannose-6-phosphate isomerase, class I [Acidobacteria bacterium]|nr:mannose-6-phosphate isomerase, class I [Acidobacteriota bacterium]